MATPVETEVLITLQKSPLWRDMPEDEQTNLRRRTCLLSALENSKFDTNIEQ